MVEMLVIMTTVKAFAGFWETNTTMFKLPIDIGWFLWLQACKSLAMQKFSQLCDSFSSDSGF